MKNAKNILMPSAPISGGEGIFAYEYDNLIEIFFFELYKFYLK